MNNQNLIVSNHNFTSLSQLEGIVKIKGHSNTIHFSNSHITLKLYGDYNRIQIENSNSRVSVKGNRNIIVLHRSQIGREQTEIDGKDNQIWVDNQEMSAFLSSSEITEAYKIIYDEEDTIEQSEDQIRRNSEAVNKNTHCINETHEIEQNKQKQNKISNDFTDTPMSLLTGKKEQLLVQEQIMIYEGDNPFEGIWDKKYTCTNNQCLFGDSQQFRLSRKMSDSMIF